MAKSATAAKKVPTPQFGKWSTFLINKAKADELCQAGHDALIRWIKLETEHPELDALGIVKLAKKITPRDVAGAITAYMTEGITDDFESFAERLKRYRDDEFHVEVRTLAGEFLAKVNERLGKFKKLTSWPVPNVHNNGLVWYTEEPTAKERK